MCLFRATWLADGYFSLSKSSFLLSRYPYLVIKKLFSSSDFVSSPRFSASTSSSFLRARYLYSYEPKEYIPFLDQCLSSRSIIPPNSTLVFGQYFQNIGHISLIDLYTKSRLLDLSNLNFLYVSSPGLCSNIHYLECICKPLNIPIWTLSPLAFEEIHSQSSLYIANPSSVYLSNSRPTELYKTWNMILRHWGDRSSLCSLSSAQNYNAKALLSASKIDISNQFVVLHIRRGSKIDHRQSGASTKLNSYIASIYYLHSLGIQTIIIGISSDDFDVDCTSLPCSTIILQDLPNYSNLLDIYCIANCYFFVGCGSGPLSVAPTYGKPVLYTNAPCLTFSPAFKNSLMIPSHIINKSNSERLSASESLDCELSHSPILSNKNFARISNSSEEILSGVFELIVQLKADNPFSSYTLPSPLLYSEYSSTAGMNISRSFLDLNPYFNR